MKRILSLILTLHLILCLAACAGNPAAQPAITEAGAEESSALHGTIREDAYVNEALKLRIAKPESWAFCSDEQLAQANNETPEAFRTSDIPDSIQRNGYFIDTMMSARTGDTISLLLQAGNSLPEAVSDELLYEALEQKITQQFETANMRVSTYETIPMQVGGQTRSVLHIAASSSGIPFDEYRIWYRENEDCSGIVTLTVLSGSDPQPILDGITTLK